MPFPSTRILRTSLSGVLRELGHRPFALFGLLLLLNAFVMPYAGIIHDAQIYAGLVLNRLDPALLSDDLFFRYGSQDQYSIFSPLVAPFAQILGLRVTFFLGYVACSALFLAALVRFTTRLWPDSPGAIAGLIFLAMVPVAYGGYVPLHVLEPFFTARLPACALTFWALAEFLDRRWLRGSLSLATAFALHPLMTFPALLGLAIVALLNRFGPWKTFGIGLIGFAGVGVILATPSLAARLFGRFDAEWLQLTRQSNTYQFPQEWFPEQWYWNLFALAGLSTSAWLSRHSAPQRAKTLAAAAAVGALGLFGSLLFTQLPYALLLKGQAYRWLWLPLALTPPAVIDLAWNAWRSADRRARLGAVVIALSLGTTRFIPLEFACQAAFVPVFLYGFTIFAKEMDWSKKLIWSLLLGAVVGFAVWSVFIAWIFVVLCGDGGLHLSAQARVQVVVASLTLGLLFPLVLWSLAVAGPRRVAGRFAGALMAAAALLVCIASFGWLESEQSRERGSQNNEMRFVESFLNEKRAELGRHVCIYSDYGSLGVCWVDWRARSYYDCFQLAGMVFNRENALEGKRRTETVAAFEAASLARARWSVTPDECKTKIEGWLEVPVGEGTKPTEDDLLRLAREPSIDFIVLFGSRFDDLACARRGDVSIYDCRALRESFVHIPPVVDLESNVEADAK